MLKLTKRSYLRPERLFFTGRIVYPFESDVLPDLKYEGKLGILLINVRVRII